MDTDASITPCGVCTTQAVSYTHLVGNRCKDQVGKDRPIEGGNQGQSHGWGDRIRVIECFQQVDQTHQGSDHTEGR